VCPPAQRPGKSIRCVVAHDHVLLRQGLRRLLEDAPDIAVVAEAGNAAEALRRVFEHRPEVVIAAAHIFKCDADNSERLILRESPKSSVLFLRPDRHDLPAHPGAAGAMFAERHTSAEELVEMVRGAAFGGSVEHEIHDVAAWPVEEFVPRNRALTGREREVLKLLAEGRTVRSAASILGVSIKTVDAHKFNLMRKLGIHNKAELVMWAIQKKVVKLPVNF
jgi:two-component system, NarL family, response regulator NreC